MSNKVWTLFEGEDEEGKEKITRHLDLFPPPCLTSRSSFGIMLRFAHDLIGQPLGNDVMVMRLGA